MIDTRKTKRNLICHLKSRFFERKNRLHNFLTAFNVLKFHQVSLNLNEKQKCFLMTHPLRAGDFGPRQIIFSSKLSKMLEISCLYGQQQHDRQLLLLQALYYFSRFPSHIASSCIKYEVVCMNKKTHCQI